MAFQNKLSFIEFRKYQLDILDDFESRRAGGERKFHYIAPPGSGKTLIGLELFLRLGEKALVLSPTLAIQDQWARMCRTYTQITEVSFDPASGADLLSLTYQSVSVKDGEDLHKNSKAILEALKDRRTIIFDECHHLTSFWGSILKQLDTPDRFFIGLTATVPFETSPREWDVYEKLLDTVDYEVSLPPVIKDGCLAPYNDLVYLVSPTNTELALINSRSRLYRETMAELGAAGGLLSPQAWAYERLENFTDETGKTIPFDELYRKREGLCLALARFSQRQGLGLPYSVIYTPGMEEPADFGDILEVMTDYAFNYLSKARVPEAPACFEKVLAAFKEMGYLLSAAGTQALPGNIREILGQSRGKMQALPPILESEAALMGEDLRCLVLCEQESGGSGCDALETFRFICEHTDLPALLISGKRLLVRRADTENFLIAAAVFFEKKNPCGA
jgi:hypothetical protein